MDNFEQNTSPLGEADVTASQGQLDATETQPVETEATVDGGDSGEAGQASNPWDNDPKFKGKSSDDIYKAYKEAEKLTGQLSQKAHIANLIEQKYGVTPDQLKAQMDNLDYQQQQERYANNPLAPVLDKVSALEQKLAQKEQQEALATTEKELDKFLKENPDYESSRDKILKLALTPGIGFDPNTGEDKDFADIAHEWVGQVRAQGQQDAYKKIDTKVMTQATGVSQAAPRGRVTPEEMDKMSAAELEAILPHADTSQRLY